MGVRNTRFGVIWRLTHNFAGIGSEIVKELSHRGGHIIMCCRNVENGEKVKQQVMKCVPKARIDVRQLDLCSFENVRGFVKSIGEKNLEKLSKFNEIILLESDYSKVDILINNAGVTFHPFKKTCDGFETHLQVNYLSHFLMTHLLMPLLKKSKQGRVINVSAHAYATGKMNIDDPLCISNLAPAFHPRDAFSHSKLSTIMWTRKLASVLTKSTAVTVNCLLPGLVRGTKHMRQSPIMKVWSARMLMLPWMYLFMKPPVMGAQTAIYLATETSIASTSGKLFK